MTQHQCLHAKRQQLVRELNQVVHQQYLFLKQTGVTLGQACDEPEFITLLTQEDDIQTKIEKIDRTDCAAY